MILVTGASGTVGGAAARQLARAGHAVRLLSRSPDRLVPPPGRCEVAAGDYADPASLRAAVRGVRAMLVVTGDPRTTAHDAALLEAARGARVRRAVKLSAQGVADADAQDMITRWQRATERLTRESGLEWTLLRPRAFMSNSLGWAPAVRAGDTVRTWPADVPAACVDPRDVAEAAVLALTGPGHRGRAYPLTGPEQLTARERVRLLGESLGRELECREEPRQRALDGYARRYGSELAEALLACAGRRSGTEPALERLLGRPPRRFAEWARDHAGHFTAAPGSPRLGAAGG
ncbi:NAD(P)H-binding protein [Streptomyces sp. SB3404]|uniref:NAD(P)H-binding protein n=1 Tax=Streptomyces boncukensis TaxID=2711219 RepID=A0A6G4WUH0_9ACTN|nr:NAD(P)H-binding protein [Streptomyces boncukensis]